MNMSFLQNRIHLVLQPFTDLSIVTSISPDAMKIAEVIPWHKTGVKDEFNEHRLIALLPQFVKFLISYLMIDFKTLFVKIIFGDLQIWLLNLQIF